MGGSSTTAIGERGDNSSSAVTGVAVPTGDRGDWSSTAVTGVGVFSGEENEGDGIESADSPVPDLDIRGDVESMDSNLLIREEKSSEFSLGASTNRAGRNYKHIN